MRLKWEDGCRQVAASRYKHHRRRPIDPAMWLEVILTNTFRRRTMSQGVMPAFGHGLSEPLPELPRRGSLSIDAGLADAMLRLALRGLATRAASDILAVPRSSKAQTWVAVS
jgi:hypothetical protein